MLGEEVQGVVKRELNNYSSSKKLDLIKSHTQDFDSSSSSEEEEEEEESEGESEGKKKK